MANEPANPIVEIRTELYRPDLYNGKPHNDVIYRLFIIEYKDGSGKIYKVLEHDYRKSS